MPNSNFVDALRSEQSAKSEMKLLGVSAFRSDDRISSTRASRPKVGFPICSSGRGLIYKIRLALVSISWS